MNLESVRLSDVVPYQEYRRSLGQLLKEVTGGRKLLVVRDNDRIVVLAAHVYEELAQRLARAERRNAEVQKEV